MTKIKRTIKGPAKAGTLTPARARSAVEAVSRRRASKDPAAKTGRAGITTNSSVEGNTIAEVMDGKPGVKVSRFPYMVRIDGEKTLEFDMAEIAEALGVEEFSPEDFEIETTTHYGRMVRLDDRVLVFANPEDAAEYLGFDPPADQVSDSDEGQYLGFKPPEEEEEGPTSRVS